MRVLVACEFSQIVTAAFRARGHEAFSCDILPCEGGHPEWHIQDDVLLHLEDGWDLMIAHPPCTYLSYAGTRHWNNVGRAKRRSDAMAFFMELVNAPVPKICIENPLGLPSKVYRRPDQVIEPYHYGDNARKRTCLWLKGLPILIPNRFTALPKPEPLYYLSNGKAIHHTDAVTGNNRAHERSKTFPGIARAMAERWG